MSASRSPSIKGSRWFFSVQTDAFLTVYVWCCGLVTGIFLIIMQSGLVLLNASWRDFCHRAIWQKLWIPSPLLSTGKFNFPVSQNEVKSCLKISYPAHARVVPFPVNRALRIFSCFLLANNTLKPVNCLRQRPVSFVFKLTYFLLHFF